MLPRMIARVLFILSMITLTFSPLTEGAEPRKLRIGLIPGAQDFIMHVMETQNFLRKHNVLYEKEKVLSPPTVHLFIAEKKVDLGFGGFTVMARARAEGKGTLVIGAMFSPTNFVLVPKDSPAKSLVDLKGKRVGIFGGPGATTSIMLFAIAKRWYGVDLQKESQIITAPSPALAGLLDNRELGAALVGTIDSLKLSLAGKYRTLLDLSEEWEKRAGRAPAHVSISTNDDFARAYPDLLKNYMKAYVETVKYIRLNPSVWESYGKEIKMTSKEEIALLRERIGPRIVERWDRQQMDIQKDFLEVTRQILGPKVLKTVPEGLMTDAYNP